VTSIAVGGTPFSGTNVLLNAPGAGSPLVTTDGTIWNVIGDLYYTGSIVGEGPNIGGLGSAPYDSLAIDLSNDHPVSFPWPAGYPDIQKPTNPKLRLFGPSERIECSTCHNVHDKAIPPFLSMSNANSAMCLQCHKK
jgi:predicted CXXCH cytochrome family protein